MPVITPGKITVNYQPSNAIKCIYHAPNFITPSSIVSTMLDTAITFTAMSQLLQPYLKNDSSFHRNLKSTSFLLKPG
jgi:hypothetical protein